MAGRGAGTIFWLVDDDGMVVIHARLTPEAGAVVRRALDVAAQQLRDEARDAAAPASMVEETTAGQRRADALLGVAEAALAGGLDNDNGTAGDRYHVVVHVDAVDGHGGIEVGNGRVDVSAETSRRLACDASVVVMHHDADGSPLDVGRKTRTIPPAIRRALESRDACCQFPGCTGTRCDAHHIDHWADGGATSLGNLVRLCRRHHRFVHEGGWRVRREPDAGVTFTNERRARLTQAPPPPAWAMASGPPQADPLEPTSARHADPLEATGRRLCASGVTARQRTSAVWDGTPFRLHDVMDVLRGRESPA